jgi:CHAT domain-containing protein/predicted negative regulator of RcsB-dependent stress response
MGQEKPSRLLEIGRTSPHLLVVEQQGEDVAVAVSAARGDKIIYDSHLGRTGPELVLLEPGAEEEFYSIEILPEDAAAFSVTVIPLTGTDAALDTLRNYSRAAALPKTDNHEQLRQALSYYEQVVDRAGDSEIGQLAGFMRAVLLYRLADYGAARQALDRVDDVKYLQSFPYRKLWLQGEIEFSQDLYGQSKDTLGEALALSSDGSLDAADIKINLGFSHVLNGEAETGKALLDEALATATMYGDNAVIGRAYNNLGGYYSVTGDPTTAAAQLQLAVEYLRNSSDSQLLNYAMSNLSMTYRGLGQYQLAREMSHMALGQAESSANPVQLSGAYTGLASLYLRMGEYEMAEEFARLAAELVVETDREWRANTLMNMQADALVGLGRHEEAIALYLQTNQYFQVHGPESRLLSNAFRLARSYLELGQIEDAGHFLGLADDMMSGSKSLDSRSNLSTLIELKARRFLVTGEPASAVTLLTESLEDTAVQISTDHVEMADLLMQAYVALENFEAAVAQGQRATDLILRIRQQLDYARLGPAWSKQSFPVFLRYFEALVKLHERTGDAALLNKAFLVAEQGQAFDLSRQREASLFSQSPASEESRALLTELTSLARDRAARATSAEGESLDLEYFRALERYQASLDLNADVPEFRLHAMSELQDHLSADEALVKFLCVPDANCYRFVLGSQAFTLTDLGSADDIHLFSLALQNELRQPGTVNLSASERLGQLLFDQGFVDALGPAVKHLHVSGNYPLDSIPLAVLEYQQGSLVQHFSLNTIPAASALLEPPVQRHSYDYDLAIMADPEFSPAVSDARLLEGLAYAEDSLRGWYGELERLPWSALEAENLQQVFSEQRVRTLTGNEANKPNLLDARTRNSRIVHIASHGYFNQATPDLVGIATSPAEGDGGFMTLEDLLMHPFNSELVVISGCETGLGQDRGGEGMMSLSRAFLGQGVDHVIATQWPVSDRASAEFMKLFYEALDLETMNVAQALREAQLQLAAMPAYRSPFYWAPYVLTSIGDG